MKQFTVYERKSYFNKQYTQEVAVYTDEGEHDPRTSKEVSYDFRTIKQYKVTFSATGKTVKHISLSVVTIDCTFDREKPKYKTEYEAEYVEGKEAKVLYKKLNAQRLKPFEVTYTGNGYQEAIERSADCLQAKYTRENTSIALTIRHD